MILLAALLLQISGNSLNEARARALRSGVSLSNTLMWRLVSPGSEQLGPGAYKILALKSKAIAKLIGTKEVLFFARTRNGTNIDIRRLGLDAVDRQEGFRRIPKVLWILVFIIIVCGCDRLVGGQTWHEQHGWKAADFFTDPQVIALCDAIAANDVVRMKELIAAGADVNACGKGNMTPLLWAFFDNKPERFRLLLEAGSNPNVYTNSDFGNPRAFQPGDSVTHMASRSNFGHFWPVFEHGGDPNLPSKLRGFSGRTPVYFVIESGAADKKERITRLAKLGASLNRPEGVSSSPLVTAEGHFGRYDLCLLLLDLGADPTKYEGNGVSRITHKLCGTLSDKERGVGQLRDASPEKMKAFEDLVKRLESMGLSMAAAQADRERWGNAKDLIELGEMRRKEREERERREKQGAEENGRE